jgi:hypothetical protein
VLQQLRATARAARAERAELHVDELRALYRRALTARDYRVALDTARQIARVEGYEKPRRLQLEPGMPANPGGGDPWAERSDAELEHYIEHGYFAEEAPVAVGLLTPGSPGATDGEKAGNRDSEFPLQ